MTAAAEVEETERCDEEDGLEDGHNLEENVVDNGELKFQSFPPPERSESEPPQPRLLAHFLDLRPTLPHEKEGRERGRPEETEGREVYKQKQLQ
ncbi:hypothetical protein H6P81_014102 [Aristolochia fimbriata]|uniref:Uncharacterized protein n=1 Tax=Aristolochia fimbriata TaxID=158543 RepID=A0AAV7EGZ3_ARIFI|nr:hypothetical protein H6P81_014102 [Aristolochia fimbriata]